VQNFQDKYIDLREFYDWLFHRIKLTFHPKMGSEDPKSVFELVLNRRYTYNQLSTKVGEYLGVLPTHIRFYPVNMANNRPRPPIKYTTQYQLGQILSGYSAYGTPSHRPDCLFYEVLECSMAELETRKFLKLVWLPDGLNKEV
jgi:ubiquitin carboxyl-terminal hydrolase 7